MFDKYVELELRNLAERLELLRERLGSNRSKISSQACARGQGNPVKYLTTDLAIYEACNSLWKLSTLLKSISLEDAVDVATMLEARFNQ